jgi:hypothetical protein
VACVGFGLNGIGAAVGSIGVIPGLGVTGVFIGTQSLVFGTTGLIDAIAVATQAREAAVTILDQDVLTRW